MIWRQKICETPGQLKFWSWLHGFQFVFTDQSIQRMLDTPISSSQKANENSQISPGLWVVRTFHSRGHGPHECWKIFHGYENRAFCEEKCCTARRLENIYQCSIFFLLWWSHFVGPVPKSFLAVPIKSAPGAIVPRRYFHLLLQKLHDLSISFKTQGKAGNLCLELLVFWQEII